MINWRLGHCCKSLNRLAWNFRLHLIFHLISSFFVCNFSHTSNMSHTSRTYVVASPLPLLLLWTTFSLMSNSFFLLQVSSNWRWGRNLLKKHFRNEFFCNFLFFPFRNWKLLSQSSMLYQNDFCAQKYILNILLWWKFSVRLFVLHFAF